MSKYTNEIEKRRTFAIISHPDAGKTTLTEKFLLYGGAINLAGSVKGKATARHAVSDWMEIEKERGISVTSSVLQFHYDGYCINILDTPGHQDFSEDTYRTLMAADSAVMVIDGSKGVEAQTRKLFKVCVMRHIPIFTFINKMDRDANDTFDLLDEIEKELGIATCPINWPIGSGKKFRGVYDRNTNKILTFTDTQKGTKEGTIEEIDLDSPHALEVMDPEQKEQLLEEIELLDGASAEFDQEMVSKGELTPVFFGSALTNFGVETFLEHFLKMTTSPLPRMADSGLVDHAVLQGTKTDTIQSADHFILTFHRLHIFHSDRRNTGTEYIFHYHLPFHGSVYSFDLHITEGISSRKLQFCRKNIDMDKFFLYPASADPSVIVCRILGHLLGDLSELQSKKCRCVLRTSYRIQLQGHVSYLMISKIQTDLVSLCKMII